MKDYLNTYGENVTKHQAGGPVPGAAPAAAPQGPDVEGMLQEYAANPNPELAMAICDTLVAMLGAAQGAPAPEGAAPMARNGMRMSGAPKFKLGGKL